MHLLFVHQVFPSQFGPFAFRLVATPGFTCTFVSSNQDGEVGGVRCLRYTRDPGPPAGIHPTSVRFELGAWNAAGVADRMRYEPDLRPDVIVGHAGFGSTLHLRELFPDVPIVNHFEYFFRDRDSEIDFRPDFPATAADRQRCRMNNAMTLLDLHACDIGYSPTDWQRNRFPAEYRPKIVTVFDGVDTDFWKPDPIARREVQS